MGDDNKTKLKGEEIILLLFTLFGILVVLFLLLVVVILQTWALWRMAKVVVEQNTPSEMESNVSRRKSSFGGFFGGGTLVGADEGEGKKRFE